MNAGEPDDPVMPHHPGPGDDGLEAREAARARRRDRDAAAAARELMRPGMGKVFKQIQDAQAKAGRKAGELEPEEPRRRQRRV